MSNVAPFENGRNRKGRFVAGNPGGGRPPGARNKLTTCFLETLAADFAQHGRETIEAAREADPVAYLRLITTIMPKQLEAHVSADGSFLGALKLVHEQQERCPESPGTFWNSDRPYRPCETA